MVIQDQTLQQLLAEPDSGIVLENVLHAEQRFRYSRPIVAGDELTATLTVSGRAGARRQRDGDERRRDPRRRRRARRDRDRVLLVGGGDA